MRTQPPQRHEVDGMAMSWVPPRYSTDADFFPAGTGGLVVTIVTAHLLFLIPLFPDWDGVAVL